MSPSTDFRENREFASELKFLMTRPLAEQVRAWARSRLMPDPHASGEQADGYQTTSLYFDTERFDVFHRRGSFGRSKYRIRRYGPSEVVFLERKLKTRGLVSKRRSVMKLEELGRLSSNEPDRHWPGCWYHRRLLAREIKPVCQIRYQRTARVALTSQGPIRLTMDEDIRALLARGLAFDSTGAGCLLLENQVILELKFRAELPTLFKQLAGEFALNPQPVSKYRLAAVALGLVAPVESNGTENSQFKTSVLTGPMSSSVVNGKTQFPAAVPIRISQ